MSALYDSLGLWVLGHPARMTHPAVLNRGRALPQSPLVLTGFPSSPSSTEGWGFRYPRPGGAGALGCDGVSQRLQLSGSGTVQTDQPCTIAWWEYIYTTTPTLWWRWTIPHGGGTSLQIFRQNGNRLRIGVATVSQGLFTGASEPVARVGQWTHFLLACTQGPTTVAGFRCYENGRDVGVASAIGASADFGGADFVGSGPAFGAFSALDDMAVWYDTALSSTEARAWYQQSLLGHPPLLTAAGGRAPDPRRVAP